MRKKEIIAAVAGDVHGNSPALEAVLALAKECKYEREHTHQVERLALEIFDQLGRLHKLGRAERFLLRCARYSSRYRLAGRVKRGITKRLCGLLWIVPFCDLISRDRRIIGLIARYHRKALPKEQHTYFRDLDTKDRNIVRKLAGILRVADGLDRMHQSKVKDISCRVDKKAG